MSLTTEIKNYAGTALEQGKNAVAEGAKPIYALVGAGDYAVDQVKELAQKASERASSLRNVDFAEVRKSLEKAFEDYSTAALGFYTQLTERGEKVLGEVREDVSKAPAVKKAVDVAGDATASAQALFDRGVKTVRRSTADAAEAVSEGAEKVEAAAAPRRTAAKKAATTRAARKPAAKKAPAKAAAK